MTTLKIKGPIILPGVGGVDPRELDVFEFKLRLSMFEDEFVFLKKERKKSQVTLKTTKLLLNYRMWKQNLHQFANFTSTPCMVQPINQYIRFFISMFKESYGHPIGLHTEL